MLKKQIILLKTLLQKDLAPDDMMLSASLILKKGLHSPKDKEPSLFCSQI